MADDPSSVLFCFSSESPGVLDFQTIEIAFKELNYLCFAINRCPSVPVLVHVWLRQFELAGNIHPGLYCKAMLNLQSLILNTQAYLIKRIALFCTTNITNMSLTHYLTTWMICYPLLKKE